MSPKELHEICHEAMQECPQFDYYEDDSYFCNYGEFKDIPKKGFSAVIRFWKEETSLFDTGYNEALPKYVQEAFEELDAVISNTINNYFKNK